MRSGQYTFLFLLLSIWISPNLLAQQQKKHQIYFETAQFVPNASEIEQLKKFADLFKGTDISQIQFTGYCDDRGGSAYNLRLSEQRAKKTANLFATYIKQSQAEQQARGGGEIPLTRQAEASQDEERTQNRRVEITVTFKPNPIHVVREPEPKIEEPKIEVIEPLTPVIKQQQIFSEATKVGDRIILDHILFEGGRHFILPESEESLINLLKTLRENTKYHVMILGHICCQNAGTDGVDNDTGARNLSAARARVIYDFLVANGVDAKRLSHKGMRADYKLGGADKYDRRVEIEVTKIEEN